MKKVGVRVKSDLDNLARESENSIKKPFVGAVDLATLAKERLISRHTQMGLSDLCALILKKNLQKNVPERVSSLWSQEILTDAQRQYAALDAYTALAIYNTITRSPPPQILPIQIPDNMQVILYPSDLSNPIAHGHIWGTGGEQGTKYDDIKITKTRAIIVVDSVLVPGAVVGLYKPARLLSSFGSTPFHLVCNRSHLRTSSEDYLSPTIQPIATEPIEENYRPITDLQESSSSLPSSDQTTIRGLLSEPSSGNTVETPSVELAAQDTASYQQCEIIQHEVAEEIPKILRSRVLKDVWHVLDMLYISRQHGAGRAFAIAMRDAVLIPDPEDKKQLELWASTLTPPQSWKELTLTRPKWVWQRCKRTIPPPEQLLEAVSAVFKTYGSLKDATTGLPLFNAAAWKTSKNILQLIRLGHVSDPPGIPLYYSLRTDQHGLTVYRCIRGTNFVEGGVHRHMRDMLPSSGASVRHLLCCLKDFVLRHNLSVSAIYIYMANQSILILHLLGGNT